MILIKYLYIKIKVIELVTLIIKILINFLYYAYIIFTKYLIENIYRRKGNIAHIHHSILIKSRSLL